MHFRYKLRSDCFETPKNFAPINSGCLHFGLLWRRHLPKNFWQGRRREISGRNVSPVAHWPWIAQNFGFLARNCIPWIRQRAFPKTSAQLAIQNFLCATKNAPGQPENVYPVSPTACNLITSISLCHCGHTNKKEYHRPLSPRSFADIYK